MKTKKMQDNDTLETIHAKRPPSCFLPPEDAVSLVKNHTEMPYFFYLPSNEFWSRNYFVHKNSIELSDRKK